MESTLSHLSNPALCPQSQPVPLLGSLLSWDPTDLYHCTQTDLQSYTCWQEPPLTHTNTRALTHARSSGYTQTEIAPPACSPCADITEACTDHADTHIDTPMPNKLLFHPLHPHILQHPPYALLIQPHTCGQTCCGGTDTPPPRTSSSTNTPGEANLMGIFLTLRPTPKGEQEGEDPTPQPAPNPWSPTTTPTLQKGFTSPSTLHVCLHLSSSPAATRRQVRLAEMLFPTRQSMGSFVPAPPSRWG